MQVDFAEVRKIPIASALAMYKIETRKRSNSELVANCPFPSHKEASADHKWTLAISIPKNKFYCHSDTCRAASNKPKGGDVIDAVCLLDNTLPLDAAKKLASLFCLSKSLTGATKDSNGVAQADDDTVKEILNKPLAFILKDVNPVHDFIQSRGITVETAVKFNVGYFGGKGSMSQRVVFPCYENGSLVAYVGRTVLEVTPDNPKWKLPAGLHRTFLYGLEKCEPSKPLTLCESPWGVLWMFQHQIQAAALIGSSLTEQQEKLLTPYAEIRVALDNDSAGREAAEKIVARLKGSHKVTKAFLKD